MDDRHTLRQTVVDRSPDLVVLPHGTVRTGSKTPVFRADGEHLRRRRKVGPLSVAPSAVTNAEFADFVDQTGYQTDAEAFGTSLVFHLDLPAVPAGPSWWHECPGATWRTPTGPGSDIADVMDHPVVHVSQNDAKAYANWRGGRLPTEAKWEYAAKGNQPDPIYPWGDTDPQNISPRPLNIWRGHFPDDPMDGRFGTVPVNSYPANDFGLYQMVGNVWEWTASTYQVKSVSPRTRKEQKAGDPERQVTLKGGSFLCHRSYCWRYRIAARSAATPQTSAAHIGMRLFADIDNNLNQVTSNP